MRKFKTGATRDSDNNKLDYEGFISMLVLEGYAKYMHKHRKQPDGKLRDSDNWQKGIPIEAYRKSLIRHILQAWSEWRGNKILDDKGNKINQKEALYASLFNLMGLLHEMEKSDNIRPQKNK